MQTKKLVAIGFAAAAGLVIAGFALAQGPGAIHDRPHARTTGDQSAPSLAFTAANEKMHRDMAITFTGNADVDFVRGMIPHHQGAIDMAKITLAFGKDPEIRKLAEEIVKAQETEIAFMRSWLAKKGSN